MTSVVRGELRSPPHRPYVRALALLCPRTPVSYWLVEELQKKAVPVSQLPWFY